MQSLDDHKVVFIATITGVTILLTETYSLVAQPEDNSPY